MSMFDIKGLATEAEQEFLEEKKKEAKKQIIELQKKIDAAEKIVRNLKREKEDLLVKLTE